MLNKGMSISPPSTLLSVEPLSGSIGAELSNVDLSADLSDALIVAIRQALLDHGVIFFHDQNLDTDAHKRLALRFGDIFIHPFFDTRGQDPEIVGEEKDRDPFSTRNQQPPRMSLSFLLTLLSLL